MKNNDLPKNYEHLGTENAIYQKWEKSGAFAPTSNPDAQSFVISIPPPNATGKLHIGHAMMLAVEDLMIRYHRLKGDATLWLPGQDHAAIATQNVVEKQIWQTENKDRHQIGRDELLRRINEFVEGSRDTIRQQFRKMGSSLDWSRERYTLDDGLSRAVRMVFRDMYNDGLIYRGNRVVNWCTRCQSTLSDDEVNHKEVDAKLYTFKYDANFPISISTTRPETKVGDTAVAVNPADERYANLIGQTFSAIFADIKLNIKIVGSEEVDADFGTGALGVTPAHSMIDAEIATQHNLPSINVIGQDGKMTNESGDMIAGLLVIEAREKIVAWLKENNLLEKEEEIKQNLSVCYRCSTPIEPLISKQWFVNVNKPLEKLGGKSLRQKSLEVVQNGDIKIIPERFEKTYIDWMNNLHDWCISRQIWFGHRIPVWYKRELGGPHQAKHFKQKSLFEKLNVDEIGFRELCQKIGSDDYAVCPEDEVQLSADFIKALEDRKLIDDDWIRLHEIQQKIYKDEEIFVGLEAPTEPGWTQDPDTLDTWFSSGLWTFSTLLDQNVKVDTLEEWRAQSPDLKRFHPTSVLETGYDILFFWVARMILMTTYAMDEVPFKKVYLHGLVRDEQGRKMSKSLNNGIDPLDVITEYGADPVRLSLLIGVTPGNDARLSVAKIGGYRNFVNKLWNISRYILMTTEETSTAPTATTLADKWILAEFNELKHRVTDHIENYRFSPAGEELYEFTWSKLADWYLEIAKIEGQKDAILRHILRELLILWHPYTPFVTENIWSQFNDDQLMTQSWPVAGETDTTTKSKFTELQQIIGAARDIKQELGTTDIVEMFVYTENKTLVTEQKSIIEKLARSTISIADAPPESATKRVLIGATVYTNVEVSPEIKARQAKERTELEKYIQNLSTKLANVEFSQNAPAHVVAEQEKKLQEAKEKLAQLQ